MKKILISVIILVMFYPVLISATGNIAVSSTNLTIEKGETATFKVTATNATGKVVMYSNDTSIASINKSSEWLDISSVTVTVTGKTVGTTTIYVDLYDAATYDSEELTGTYSVKVTVIEPETSTEPSSSNDNNYYVGEPTLSTVNTLSSLEVEDYELEYLDGEYYLTVGPDVEYLNIIATADDDTATISGDGKQNLKVGLNELQVFVTSESGSKKTYVINVTKKDALYLDDLTNELSEDIESINLKILSTDILTEEILNEIKESNKIVNLDYYEDDVLLYSWIIDGASLEDTQIFDLNLEYSLRSAEDYEIATNYAYGIYLDFTDYQELSEGISLKINVQTYFEDGENLHMYCWFEDEFKLLSSSVEVSDGYVEFKTEILSSYFFTKSNLESIDDVNSGDSNYLVPSILIIIFAGLLSSIIYMVVKRTLNKKNLNQL